MGLAKHNEAEYEGPLGCCKKKIQGQSNLTGNLGPYLFYSLCPVT